MERRAHRSRQRLKQRQGRPWEVPGSQKGSDWLEKRMAGSRRPESDFQSSPCLYSTVLRSETPGSTGSMAKRQGGNVGAFIVCSRASLQLSTTRPLSFERGSDTGQLKALCPLQREVENSGTELSISPWCNSFSTTSAWGYYLKLKINSNIV